MALAVITATAITNMLRDRPNAYRLTSVLRMEAVNRADLNIVILAPV